MREWYSVLSSDLSSHTPKRTETNSCRLISSVVQGCRFCAPQIHWTLVTCGLLMRGQLLKQAVMPCLFSALCPFLSVSSNLRAYCLGKVFFWNHLSIFSLKLHQFVTCLLSECLKYLYKTTDCHVSFRTDTYCLLHHDTWAESHKNTLCT